MVRVPEPGDGAEAVLRPPVRVDLATSTPDVLLHPDHEVPENVSRLEVDRTQKLLLKVDDVY